MIDDDDELDWGEEGPPSPGPGSARLEPDTGAERNARYEKKRRGRGQVRVAVWVPADRVDELRQFAAKLRET